MLEINNPDVLAEVSAAFQRYEQALVSNDVEALDALFWNHTSTLRYGVNENLYGFEAIADFRLNRAPMDMTRDLMNTIITTYGSEVAAANTEFRRKGAGVTGRQSHVWVRTDDGWKIAAAHVSLLLPKTAIEPAKQA
jgi:ketosteroid isomerase-like protein